VGGRGDGGKYQNNDDYEEEVINYDEDYEVSFDKTYPAEKDFVEDSLMTPKALNGLESSMMSPGMEMKIKGSARKGKYNVKDIGKDIGKSADDFELYLNSMSPAAATPQSKSIGAKSPARQFSANSLEASIFVENPLRRASAVVKASPTPPEKKAGEEEKELDELEQYLLKLSTS
jgi:hypothetical protein